MGALVSAAGVGGVAPSTVCPVCGSVHVVPYTKAGPLGLERCAECSLVFYPVEPMVADMEQHYSAAYFDGGTLEYTDYIGDEDAHRVQARRYLREIAKYVQLPCSILDIGCAAGFFLDEARRLGCEVMGCDVSEYANKYAREVLSLEVVHGDFGATRLLRSGFDVITAFNSFEHLPAPTTVANRLHALLRPGGVAVIETWDYQSLIARLLGPRWHQWNPPYIPYYFTRRTFTRLLPPPAWTMLRYKPSSKLISVSQGMGVLASPNTSPLIKRAVSGLAESRFGSVYVPYALGDLVLTVLRRE
jgi:2-polyprenyl-3-methyl-5-hydroxy-6-metoxy-1,4-benzoquinol methylase